MFVASTNPLGTNPGRFDQVFVVNRDGTGLRQLTTATLEPPSYAPIRISIGDDGERIAFTHTGDLTGGNPGGWFQVFAIQADGTGLRQLTSATDGDVRGVALSGNLGPGLGNTVQLGAVVCLEDDSPDSDTRGNEDAAEPSAGQAFFYLYRGSQGLADGPGSFGQGKGGAERVAGTGSCLP